MAGYLESALVAVGTAFMAITSWAWKSTHSTIKEKADAAQVLVIAAEVKSKADSRIVDGIMERVESIFDNQRHDNQRIFEAIESVNKLHSEFAQKCAEEFGKRPTRDECGRLWDHRQG